MRCLLLYEYGVRQHIRIFQKSIMGVVLHHYPDLIFFESRDEPRHLIFCILSKARTLSIFNQLMYFYMHEWELWVKLFL